MVKREKNDSGLNLCRAFKARPSMNRVKHLQSWTLIRAHMRNMYIDTLTCLKSMTISYKS